MADGPVLLEELYSANDPQPNPSPCALGEGLATPESEQQSSPGFPIAAPCGRDVVLTKDAFRPPAAPRRRTEILRLRTQNDTIWAPRSNPR
jgi:hypothetical protein